MSAELNTHIGHEIKVLKQLYIWKYMSESEKMSISNARSEIEVDRLVKTYTDKYYDIMCDDYDKRTLSVTLGEDQTIDSLGLSKRTYNALLRNHIYTTQEFHALVVTKGWQTLRGFGATCAEEMIAKRMGVDMNNATESQIKEVKEKAINSKIVKEQSSTQDDRGTNAMRTFTINETITNPDMGDFTIIAISEDGQRTLLLNHNPKAMNRYIGAYLLQERSNGNGCYWANGHYHGDNFEAAAKYVCGIEEPEFKPDEIAIVVEEGWVRDVYSTNKHNVEVLDLDSQEPDFIDIYRERLAEIKNDDKYKMIY